MGFVVGACVAGPVGAQESGASLDAAGTSASSGGPSSPADKTVLDAMIQDPGLSLLHSGDTMRVPLVPRDWSLNGVRPYAAVGARTLRPVTDGLVGMAMPSRESMEDLHHGLGLGAGLQWQLSEHLDLFGEYLFQTKPGTGVTSTSPVLRPDSEGAGGVRGGFSFHF